MANLFQEGRQRIVAGFRAKERAGETAAPEPAYNHVEGRTALQRIIESGEGRDLEELLTAPDKDLVLLAKKYQISPNTLYQWRVRLGLTRGGMLKKIGKV